MNDDPNTIKLPSGKTVEIEVDGFIGINAIGEISKGYDTRLYEAYSISDEELWQSWSTEDKLALAEIMIKRWEDYQQAVLRNSQDAEQAR